MKMPQLPAYLQGLFDKYKYILLVLLVGLVLLLWPQREDQPQTPRTDAAAVMEETAALEGRICAILRQMDGVGEASVLLTVESGEETVYAYDRTESRSQQGDSASLNQQRELVTLSDSGGQSPVSLRQQAPVYRGAVVVCQGGDSAAVRLAVTQVIQSLTGLSADRIVISKMKQ